MQCEEISDVDDEYRLATRTEDLARARKMIQNIIQDWDWIPWRDHRARDPMSMRILLSSCEWP